MMQLAVGTASDLERSERRNQQLEQEVRRLTKQLRRDGLTGLGNREHFETVLEAEIRGRLGRELPGRLGLLILDVDRFKGLNDTHGHLIGDEVLRVVAQAICGTSRATDVPARIGGDEFAVIVPNTEVPGLELFAERLRAFVADLSIPVHGRVHTVTVSVGGATLARAASPGDGKRLVEAADRELYRAKNDGRNRISVCAAPLETDAAEPAGT
jgi:two-component system chemotaxis family response regulator WspR